MGGGKGASRAWSNGLSSVPPFYADRTVVKYHVEPQSDVPPSKQLVQQVLDAIARRDLDVGDCLPSVRGMAAEALVNPNTVGKAYRELEALGVTEGRNGSGVFVTKDGPKIAKEERSKDTLQAFEQAVLGALSAGHGLAKLTQLLGKVAAHAGRPHARGRGRRRA